MAVTPILGIPQVAPNQNNKETTINDGFSIIERSLNSSLAVSMAGGDVTLVTNDFRHHMLFQTSGQAAAANLIVPNQVRLFGVRNTGNFTVTVKTATGTVTVGVGSGSFVWMYADGADGIIKISDSAASGSVSTFTGLSDTPGGYAGNALKLVRVKADETGLEFQAPTTGSVVVDRPAGHVFVAEDAGNFADYNSASAGTFNIPDDVVYSFPIGTVIAGGQIGAGALTIKAPVGVTLNGVNGGGATLIDSTSEYSIRKRAANTWRISGDHGGVA